MTISMKATAAATMLGLFAASPLAAQAMHEAMTCTDFSQSSPETQLEVVDEMIMNTEGASATTMTQEEIVSILLNKCTMSPNNGLVSAQFAEVPLVSN